MKKNFNSIRTKLFFTLCIVIVMIIAFLVIVNSVILETLYYYSKKEASIEAYEYVKNNISAELKDSVKSELEKIALSNNFDILVLSKDKELYATKGNFLANFTNLQDVKYEVKYSIFNKGDILYSTENITISRAQDRQYGMNFIILSGKITEEEKVYIRMPVTPIQDSVEISTQFFVGSWSSEFNNWWNCNYGYY